MISTAKAYLELNSSLKILKIAVYKSEKLDKDI